MALQRQKAVVIPSLGARKEHGTGLERLWVDEPTSATTSMSRILLSGFSKVNHVLPFLSDYITTLEFARQVEKMNINSVLLEEPGRKE